MAYNDPKLALGKRRAQDTSSAEYRRKQDTCWMASNPMNDVLNPNAISGNERRWDVRMLFGRNRQRIIISVERGSMLARWWEPCRSICTRRGDHRRERAFRCQRGICIGLRAQRYGHRSQDSRVPCRVATR